MPSKSFNELVSNLLNKLGLTADNDVDVSDLLQKLQENEALSFYKLHHSP